MTNDQQRNQRWVNDPAFPQGISSFHQIENLSKGVSEIKGGLTKRELFAAMAMQRLITPILAETNQHQREHTEQVAYWATQYADALLKELGK